MKSLYFVYLQQLAVLKVTQSRISGEVGTLIQYCFKFSSSLHNNLLNFKTSDRHPVKIIQFVFVFYRLNKHRTKHTFQSPFGLWPTKG